MVSPRFSFFHPPIFNKRKRKCENASQKGEKEKNDASALVLNLTVCEIMLQFLGTDMTLQSNFQSSYELLKEFLLDHLEIKAKGGINRSRGETCCVCIQDYSSIFLVSTSR